jgi:hypothetical protein
MSIAFQWNVVIAKHGPKSDNRSMPVVLYKALVYIQQLYQQVFKLGLPEFSLTRKEQRGVTSKHSNPSALNPLTPNDL